MPVIRTPDERFKDLPGYPYKPHYMEINGVRVHVLHFHQETGSEHICGCEHGSRPYDIKQVFVLDFFSNHFGFGYSRRLCIRKCGRPTRR